MTSWGQVYVVDLGQCVKVGRSQNALHRVHDHLDMFGLDWSRYWISPFSKRAVPIETTIIREVGELYPPWIRREYFDGDYEAIVAMAQNIAERPEFSWT